MLQFPNENLTITLTSMFWVIFLILLILWAIGLICHIGFSYLALVIALILLVFRLLRARGR